MTRSRAEESLLPLALSLAAVEVGAFLVPPWSLPIPVLLMIPAGVLLWGPRWLVGSLLLASAPLFLVLFCLLVSGHAQAMAAARLALCVIAASFHLRLAGTDRIARAIRSVAARAGVARELLETLAEVLEEGAETARRAGAMVGSIRRSGRSVGLQEVADMVLSAFLGVPDEQRHEREGAEDGVRPGAARAIWAPRDILVLCCSWLFLLAGVSGL